MNAGLHNGTYYWHVDAFKQNAFLIGPWSETRSFTITGQSASTPGTPTFTSPANNATFNHGQMINFSWSGVSGGFTYELQIATSSSFASTTVDVSLPTPGYTTSSLSNRQFWWRARAMDQYGGWGPWSTVRTLTVR